MTLRYPSVADVTMRLKSTEAQAAGLGGMWTYLPGTGPAPITLGASLWYDGGWGGWFGSVQAHVYGPILLAIVADGDPPGLYYWRPDNCFYSWTSDGGGVYAYRARNAGTLALAFAGGEIDCDVRFRTVFPSGGETARAEVYIDGGLIYTFTPMSPPDPEDIVSRLSIASDVITSGREGTRFGSPVATVWDVGFDWKVTLLDGEPVAHSVSHQWPPWVAYLLAGGSDANYRVPNDLLAQGNEGWNQLTTDGDGCVYQIWVDGNGGNSYWIVFPYYTSGSIPNLSIGHHAVADTLLVTDAGLDPAGTVGWWKVQNK
jgi:hypothetical protein